jgi:peptidoglycan/LPS O-acetylase OafA/YrhL
VGCAAAGIALSPPKLVPVIEETLLMGTVFFKQDDLSFSFPYNYSDWFVGSLAFCWLFENVIFYMIACLHRIFGIMVLAVVFLPAYGVNFYLAYLGFGFCGHWWQGLPAYFIGVVLAFAIKFEHVPSSLNSVAATLATLFMLMFSFCLPTLEPLSLYVAAALPVPFLMVVGLCGTSDPLAKLFALSPLQAWGNLLSMSMYLLDKPMHVLWDAALPQHPLGEWSTTVAYLVLLASIAGFVKQFIHDPLQRMMLRACQP